MLIGVNRGADQRQVAEGLREVAELLAGAADLLRLQAQVVGVGGHLQRYGRAVDHFPPLAGVAGTLLPAAPEPRGVVGQLPCSLGETARGTLPIYSSTTYLRQRLLLLLVLQFGHLGITHGDGEAERPQNVPPSCRYSGAAHNRGNGDHYPLDVLGGQPAFLDGGRVGKPGDRRRIHCDQGGHPRQYEFPWRKGIVLNRRCGHVGERVQDGCVSTHEASRVSEECGATGPALDGSSSSPS